LYESTVINETDRIQLQELKALWEKYKSLVDKEVELVKSGKTEEARQLLLSDIDDIGDTLRDYFEAFVEYNTKKVDENKQVASTASTVMIVVIFVGILIAIALGVFISRIISKPIGQMVEAADRLALGDVEVDVKAETRDELGKLAESKKLLRET